jgi:hypothetical protein
VVGPIFVCLGSALSLVERRVDGRWLPRDGVPDSCCQKAKSICPDEKREADSVSRSVCSVIDSAIRAAQGCGVSRDG